MSEKWHNLLQTLKQSNIPADRIPLRTQINNMKNMITKRQRLTKEENAEQLFDMINNTDESHRMFEAVRQLKTCIEPKIVKDSCCL